MAPSLFGRLLRAFGGGPTAVAVLLFLAMYAVYAANTPSAMTMFGITNLLNNAVVLAIAAASLTLVVLAGEFDLSGVSVISVANCVVATISTVGTTAAESTAGDLGWLWSLLAVLAIGGAIGLVNGILVAGLGLQSLAVTIGTMIAAKGIALLILPAPGGTVADAIADGLTGEILAVVPVAAVILAGACVAWMVLKRTRLGIALYAVGADAAAARLSGIDERRTKLAAFVIAGLCYAAAGYMLSAQTGTGDPRASDALLLFMYAAVAIGGTSLMGGRGGAFGSIVGAGILTVMQKMLFALGVAEFYTNIFNGVIMIVALVIGNASAAIAQQLRRRAAWATPHSRRRAGGGGSRRR
jgi:ribose transport system permease protein